MHSSIFRVGLTLRVSCGYEAVRFIPSRDGTGSSVLHVFSRIQPVFPQDQAGQHFRHTLEADSQFSPLEVLNLVDSRLYDERIWQRPICCADTLKSCSFQEATIAGLMVIRIFSLHTGFLSAEYAIRKRLST